MPHNEQEKWRNKVRDELKTSGVFVEELSSNGTTLLIKVRDNGGSFEYGIYDQKKLEDVFCFLFSQTEKETEARVVREIRGFLKFEIQSPLERIGVIKKIEKYAVKKQISLTEETK